MVKNIWNLNSHAILKILIQEKYRGSKTDWKAGGISKFLLHTKYLIQKQQRQRKHNHLWINKTFALYTINSPYDFSCTIQDLLFNARPFCRMSSRIGYYFYFSLTFLFMSSLTNCDCLKNCLNLKIILIQLLVTANTN